MNNENLSFWAQMFFVCVFMTIIFTSIDYAISSFISRKKQILITDPLIVYYNYKVEPLDTKGVIGVISKKDFDKFMNYKDPMVEMIKGGK